MPLTIGARIGPYQVVGTLGAGGMGEVYRARDTALNRDVALKVLAAAFADDPDRLARFEREAQILASLNHPSIAQIYGLERLEGQEGPKGTRSRVLVLELVEGSTLPHPSISPDGRWAAYDEASTRTGSSVLFDRFLPRPNTAWTRG